MYRFISAAFLLAMCALAHANISHNDSGKPKPELDVQGNVFAEQKQRIFTKLADGETYSEISSNDRVAVTEALDRIAGNLEMAGSVENLTAQQKVEVFNDQELVNTVLTKAGKDSRLVCKREAHVSSRLPTTQCMTVAERRRAYEAAQSALRAKVPTLKQK